MPIETLAISIQKYTELLQRGEGHFLDFKSRNIAAAKLTRSLSAFGNADGGELYLGIEDGTESIRGRWFGFVNVEEANGFIQTFEEFFPLGSYFRYEFLRCDPLPGLVLHCEIAKTPDIRYASDGRAYLRRGAQNLPQSTDEKITRLRLNKGITLMKITLRMWSWMKLRIPKK
jgi:ATP-dependent DNA helicase RecG